MQALARKRANGGVAASRPQVVEGIDGDVVVGVPEQGMTVVRQGEELGGSTASTKLTVNLALRNRTDPARGHQCIEVAADGRWREAEACAERPCALRPPVMQRTGDPITGARVVWAGRSYGRNRPVSQQCGFHNSNVTYIPADPHTAPPEPH